MSQADTSETSEPPGQTGRDVIVVDVADPEGRLGEGARGWLSARVFEAAGAMGCGGEVRVRVVGDEEISRAHEEFLGEMGTTDVITFDLGDPHEEEEPARSGVPTGEALNELTGFPGRVLDVDLLVCFDVALRQGAERGHAVERELLLYVVHGLMHCLGHDDHEEAAAARMHAAEDRVLEAIGVGATYHGQGEGVGGSGKDLR